MKVDAGGYIYADELCDVEFNFGQELLNTIEEAAETRVRERYALVDSTVIYGSSPPDCAPVNARKHGAVPSQKS